MNYPGSERRQRRRREDDEAQAEIVERAVHDAPIVNRLLKTGKMSASALAIGTLLGGAGSFLGSRLVPHDEIVRISARVDTNDMRITRNAARQDSVLQIMSDVRHSLETMAFIQCVQLRRADSDLRPPGCDEAVAKSVLPNRAHP
jgi:hypothetical protein